MAPGNNDTRAAGAVDTGDHQRADPRLVGGGQGRHRLRDGRILRRSQGGPIPAQPMASTIVIGPRAPRRSLARSHPHAEPSTLPHTSSAPAADRNRLRPSGVTTPAGGGTGPATRQQRPTCTPGAFHMGRMLQAGRRSAVNLGLLRQGQRQHPRSPRRCRFEPAPAPSNSTRLGHHPPPPSTAV